MLWIAQLILLANQFFPGTVNLSIETEKYETVLSGKLDKYLSFLGLQIKLGYADSWNLSVSAPLSGVHSECIRSCDDKTCVLPITGENFQKSNSSVRHLMEWQLLQLMGKMNAYYVNLRMCSTHNKDSNQQLACISIPYELICPSEFLKTWIYKQSGKLGPNCYHSALAAKEYPWLLPQFISEEEFQRELNDNFKEISEPEKFGDIAVLRDGSKLEHAASFVGKNQNDELIVFTKNGKEDGYYLFMNLHDLMTDDFAYANTTVKFYRSRISE